MKEMRTGEALEILRKIRPEISRITLRKWVQDGVIKGRTETHGFFEWFLIPESEVRRIAKRLNRKREPGQPLLRPEK